MPSYVNPADPNLKYLGHFADQKILYQGHNTTKWIAGAIQHPGALTQKAKAAGQSPMAYARAKKSAPGTTGKQARLALTLSKLRKG